MSVGEATVGPRRFGQTGPLISPFVFGTMRLEPSRLSLSDATNLLIHLVDRGVTTFHSSPSYPSHAFFCEALKAVRRARPAFEPVHVVKVCEPDFDSDHFEPRRFERLVDRERAALDVDRLGIVQWLLRHPDNEDHYRIPLLMASRDALEEAWTLLSDADKVGVLAVDPYTPLFADVVLEWPVVAGLVSYLNLGELDEVDLLDAMWGRGQSHIAVRPLFAGRLTDAALADERPDARRVAAALEEVGLLDGGLTQAALGFPLLHPAVAGVMVGVSSIANADRTLDAIERARIDTERFAAAVKELRGSYPISFVPLAPR